MKIASPDVITEAFYKLTGNLLAGSETNVHPLTHPPGKVVKGATQPISLHFNMWNLLMRHCSQEGRFGELPRLFI